MDLVIGNQPSKIQGDFLESTWADFFQLFTMGTEERKARLTGLDITPMEFDKALQYMFASHISPDIVAIAKCFSYNPNELEEALFQSIDFLKIEERLYSSKEVLIKPNCIEARFPEEYSTTHPVFLESLINVLKNYIGGKIVVGEGSGHERDSTLILRNTGIGKMLEKVGVKFIDLNYDDVKIVDVPHPLTFHRIVLPESLLNSDMVISVPKMKTHHWTGVSLGMKNLFGVLPGSVYGFPKNRLHWASFPRVIADLTSVIKPGLTFIDGIVAMEGNGPLDGKRKKMNILISGTNAFSTDVISSRIMDISPFAIPKFWYCSLKKIGNPNPIVQGEKIEEVRKPLETPPNMPYLFKSSGKKIENLGIPEFL